MKDWLLIQVEVLTGWYEGMWGREVFLSCWLAWIFSREIFGVDEKLIFYVYEKHTDDVAPTMVGPKCQGYLLSKELAMYRK